MRTMYRIEEGRKATHICIEAEFVNHYDWNALHLIHTKAEAMKAVEWYITDGNTIYTSAGEYRYINREVMPDCYICYHIPGKGWTCLGEGEPVKLSDIRKADAIQAGGADDEIAWAKDESRVTVYTMCEDQLRVDIDAGELADDCEAVNVAELEERSWDALEIIRIQPTAMTAAQTAERCAYYTRRALRYFPELAEKVLTAIADPSNDGRWTDADSVTDIVWPICNALENAPDQDTENPEKAAEAPMQGDDDRSAQPMQEAAETAHRAPQTAWDDATQGAGTPRRGVA